MVEPDGTTSSSGSIGSSTRLEDIRRRRRRTVVGRVLALLGLLVAVAAALLWYMERREPEAPLPLTRELEPAPPLAEPAAPPAEPIEPEVSPSAAADQSPAPLEVVPELPPLDQSDLLVRELASALSARPELAAWLVGERLIRRFAVVVESVAEGRVPRRDLGELRPQARFSVVETDERIVIDPGSYGRYDAVAAVFASLDSEGSAALYRRLEPLIAEAYGELGNRELSFEAALGGAIHQVLSTPLVVGEAELSHHVNRYVYLDPELEDLSRAQKQLLRMGPANLRTVQAKLRELAEALEIGDEYLPPPARHEVASPES
jgi:hypothetical protein